MALIIDNHEHHNKMLAQAKKTDSLKALQDTFEYLEQYGNGEFDVHLGYDFAGYSVTWMIKTAKSIAVLYMTGGLVYHEHTKNWGVHT